MEPLNYKEILLIIDRMTWVTERHPACKKLAVVCWLWQFDWSFACLTASVVTTVCVTHLQQNPEWRHYGTV